MSKITAIEVQAKDKTRANVYLDDEFFAGISIELIIKQSTILFSFWMSPKIVEFIKSLSVVVSLIFFII